MATPGDPRHSKEALLRRSTITVAKHSKKGRPRTGEMDERWAYLLETAGLMFLSSNYDAVTLDDIAKATGVGYAFIYKKCKRKEELFVQSVRAAVISATAPLRASMPQASDNEDLEEKLTRIGSYMMASSQLAVSISIRRLAHGRHEPSRTLATRVIRSFADKNDKSLQALLATQAARNGLHLDANEIASFAQAFTSLIWAYGNRFPAEHTTRSRQEIERIARDTAKLLLYGLAGAWLPATQECDVRPRPTLHPQ